MSEGSQIKDMLWFTWTLHGHIEATVNWVMKHITYMIWRKEVKEDERDGEGRKPQILQDVSISEREEEKHSTSVYFFYDRYVKHGVK